MNLIKNTSFYKNYITPVILCIATIATYWSSLNYPFQFDDLANITKYFHIRHHTFTSLFLSGPRWIIYWLNSMIYKKAAFSPFAYRLVDLGIHLCNGLLVFALLSYALRQLKTHSFFNDNAFPLASITTLLFILHPLQTQTVSYVIQGQLEGLATLSMLCIIGMLLLYCKSKSYVSKIATLSLLCIISLFACGTKEIAIITPALALCFDWFFIAQGNLKNLKSRWPFHGMLSLLIGTFYLYLLKPTFFLNSIGCKYIAENNAGNILTAHHSHKITPYFFCISQPKVILHYLFLFIWPYNMSVEYDWKLAESFFAPDCIFPLLGLIAFGCTLLYFFVHNKKNLFLFGPIWFFICMAPRASIIPSSELLVDYKTYMSSIGIFFLLSALGVMVIKKVCKASSLKYSTSCALLLLLMISTHNRNTVWQSGLCFWGDILKKAPHKPRVHNNYGAELLHAKHYGESIPYFSHAITLDPYYPDPYFNLSVAHAKQGDLKKAITITQKGLSIHTKYPEGYNNLATWLTQEKQYDQAIDALEKAITLKPHYGKAHHNLGKVWVAKGNMHRAWQSFKTACCDADFDNPMGYSYYAKASIELKKYDHAIRAYKHIMKKYPEIKDAEFNIANAYLLAEQFHNAKKHFMHYAQKSPEDARVWFNLGQLHMMQGNDDQARQCYTKIAHLKDTWPALKEQLELIC